MSESGYYVNVEKATLGNTARRVVLYTTGQTQLALMSLPPGGEIGEEIHASVTQFIRVERGVGIATLDGVNYALSDGIALVIAAGTKHNVVNSSSTDDLKMYTLYSPPEHPIAGIGHG